MSYEFYRHLSDGQLLLLIPAFSVGIMFALSWGLRKTAWARKLIGYDEVLLDSATSNTMAGAYVVLGFVLVLAMTTVTDLENGVSEEATAIKSLERLLVLDGSSQALKSREQLLGYTKSILNDEWPVLPHGHGSSVTSSALNELYMSIDLIVPLGAKDEVVYSKILDQIARVAELRNKRNFSIESNLPHTFYVVSVLSILGFIIICALRLMEASATRAIALSAQVIMLNLMFSAILIVDLPYLGDTTTSAEPLIKAYESMQERTLVKY